MISIWLLTNNTSSNYIYIFTELGKINKKVSAISAIGKGCGPLFEQT